MGPAEPGPDHLRAPSGSSRQWAPEMPSAHFPTPPLCLRSSLPSNAGSTPTSRPAGPEGPPRGHLPLPNAGHSHHCFPSLVGTEIPDTMHPSSSIIHPLTSAWAHGAVRSSLVPGSPAALRGAQGRTEASAGGTLQAANQGLPEAAHWREGGGQCFSPVHPGHMSGVMGAGQ